LNILVGASQKLSCTYASTLHMDDVLLVTFKWLECGRSLRHTILPIYTDWPKSDDSSI